MQHILDPMDENDLLPAQTNRRPIWMRWLDVLLRSAHVLVISVLVGGAVFRIPAAQLGS